MVWAGASVAVSDWDSEVASVTTRMVWKANRGCWTVSNKRRSRPTPRRVKRPSGLVFTGFGQAGKSLACARG